MSATAPHRRVHARDLVKPRMRGHLHRWAAVVSVVTGVVLVSLAGSTTARLATAFYALCVFGLFGTSSVYHLGGWGPRGRAFWSRLDHTMIVLLIAGTYTPIAVTALHGAARDVVLGVVWGGSAVGAVLRMTWPQAPRWLVVPIYLAIGWVAVFYVPELLSGAGVTAFVLLVVGGAVYSLGGVAYALRRPDPWPNTFGYHEVFHACTLVAALAHYIAVFFAVHHN
jgi:hemolysin III